MNAPSLSITPEETEILDGLLKFVESEVMPIQRSVDKLFENQRLYWDEATGFEVPRITEARREVREVSARAGYYTMFCPESLGGSDLGVRLWFLAYEKLHHRYGPPYNLLPYTVISHFTSGPHEVWQYASPELQAEVLPDLASGKLQGAFGLTEPDAGSDSWMMRTTAVRDGDDWVINGTKQWTSWSPTADFIMVYAVTNKELFAQRKGGVTCFYVPTSTPGYSLAGVVKIFGQIGGDEGILSFDNVRVPDTYRVGELDKGFALAMLGVRHGRLSNAARNLGFARWAMEKTIDYAKIRKTFGKVIGEHQAVQTYLAENATKIYAGRCMALDAAGKIDQGFDMRDEVSMVKAYVTSSCHEVFSKCMQIHGGMGIANETRLIDAWFMSRLNQIAEGATEIQNRAIAQGVLSGRVNLEFQ
jgi:acyl-CoA dehydrogenase